MVPEKKLRGIAAAELFFTIDSRCGSGLALGHELRLAQITVAVGVQRGEVIRQLAVGRRFGLADLRVGILVERVECRRRVHALIVRLVLVASLCGEGKQSCRDQSEVFRHGRLLRVEARGRRALEKTPSERGVFRKYGPDSGPLRANSVPRVARSPRFDETWHLL